MATCVLLFFLDPLRALQSESWTSHCFMFDLNLQALTGFVTQTSRLLAALQSAVRATTGATHPVFILHWYYMLLLKPRMKSCSCDSFVTWFLFLFAHVLLYVFLLVIFFGFVLHAFKNSQSIFARLSHMTVLTPLLKCTFFSNALSWFLSALSTVAPISPAARQAPFRPASPRRRRKHRKRISKAAIRAMIM